MPRPGPRHGDCPDCGRQHEGECHLAESERNRETVEALRAMDEAIHKLPPPTHIVGPMLDVSDESLAIATRALREAWEKRGNP